MTNMIGVNVNTTYAALGPSTPQLGARHMDQAGKEWIFVQDSGSGITAQYVATFNRAHSAAMLSTSNDARGDRPFIVDGERRLREVAACEIPAVTRREKLWVNAKGERPSQLVERKGKMMPVNTGFGPEGPFTLAEVDVVECAARFVPAQMPARFAEVIRLVDLKGRPIGPR